LSVYLSPWLAMQSPMKSIKEDDVKVPVQLGVMSKCPDALLCEGVFNQVIPKVENKIDISTVYVAKIDPKDETFGVTCLHGPQECAGNVQQLCVFAHESRKVWWEFDQCQNFEGREQIGTPELALKCARTAGIDWEASETGQCAGLDGSGTGEEGIALLKKSVKLGKEMDITKSCTIVINGRKVCVHDSTWKECENGHSVGDFVRQINDEYARLNQV